MRRVRRTLSRIEGASWTRTPASSTGSSVAGAQGQIEADDAVRPGRVPGPARDVLATERRVRVFLGHDVADLLALARRAVDACRLGGGRHAHVVARQRSGWPTDCPPRRSAAIVAS